MPKAIDRSIRREFLLGAALIAAGLIVSGAALSMIQREQQLKLAQAQSVPQSTPSTNVDQKNPKDGVGSKDVALEPARPSGGTTGSSPAQMGDVLPPAPAEKIGEPISSGSSSK